MSSSSTDQTHRVEFAPDGRQLEVPSGTSLMEAAAGAGLLVEAECGGRGTCGSCLMELVGADGEQRLVYGCQTVVDRDLGVTLLHGQLVPERRRIVTGTSYLLRQRTTLEPDELNPLCRSLQIQVPAPSLELATSDRERLVCAIREAAGVDSVRLDLEVLRRLPAALRADQGRVTVTIWQGRRSAAEVMAVRPGHERTPLYGVACDLGTSTVALKLVDLLSGQSMGLASDYNRQVRSGADVISRIDVASRTGGLARLRDQALTTINVLLRRLCQQASISHELLSAITLSGNTTMVHLLLGVDPRQIREEPYVPAFTHVPAGPAAEVGLQTHPRARLHCLPAVGSYVGGDIVAGVLCQQRLARPGEVFLLIDVGTNGEIVLGGDGWMLCCACSAGPAFEGAGVSCGMRSSRGAIERIELDAGGQLRSYDVIGGGRPRGLCGSALIQLLGELLRCGLMDRGGRLRADPAHPRIVRTGRVRAYVVERGEATRSGRDLLLTEHDIDNLVRAKGAIYSGCSLLMAKVGQDQQELDTIYIAGGFGRYLAVEQAVAIGMLPQLPPERFMFVGNSSLAGACLSLLSVAQRDLGQQLASQMTYVELSAEPGYMDEYTGALFLPHTDLQRFPGAAP